MAGIGFWEWEGEGERLHWNKKVYSILGLDPDSAEPSLDLYFSLFHPEDRDEGRERILDILQKGCSLSLDHRIVTSEGVEKNLKLWGKWYSCPMTGRLKMGGMVQDISTHKRTLRDPVLTVDLFDSNVVGITVTDPGGTITFVNQAFCEITGYSMEDVMGRNPRVLKSDRHDDDFYRNMWHELMQKGKWEGEIWNRRKNGEVYAEWLTIRAIRDGQGKLLRYFAHFLDLTELQHKDAQIARYSHSDILTGYGNKEMFFLQLDSALKRAESGGKTLGVAAIDIHRFKSVNDSLGYTCGDKLLQKIAKRLGGTLGDSDLLARFGGDNFYILYPDAESAEALSGSIEAVLESFSSPFVLGGEEYYLSLNAGVSVYPESGSSREELLNQAELALDTSKERGPDGYLFFSEVLVKRSEGYLEMESQLTATIMRGCDELRVWFQPKLGLSDNDLCGFEALVRWQHPERGFLPPGEFIPLAEERGLIVPMDMWVFQEACRKSVEWKREIGRSVKIAVNFSSKQFYSADLCKKLEEVLEFTGADPRDIGIEITETGFMEDLERATRVLEVLRSMGFTLYIDDFGTGYSSLAYLKTFPVDVLKIDKSFIDHVLTDVQSAVLVKSIITMTHSLGMKVIAEGVETVEQQAFLRENSCDVIQGYLLSPPMSVDSVVDFMEPFFSEKEAL
jgi:diguanylate cyclase (GGDEF)-like protein/PAS domain S-box-containing protein